MPSLGADMESGTLVEWKVKPGDRVKRGDLIATVETVKGAIEIEVFQDAVIEKLLVEPGAQVPVNGVMALLRGEGEQVTPSAPSEPAPPPPVGDRRDDRGDAGGHRFARRRSPGERWAPRRPVPRRDREALAGAGETMTSEELDQAVRAALSEVAPEADLSTLDDCVKYLAAHPSS